MFRGQKTYNFLISTNHHHILTLSSHSFIGQSTLFPDFPNTTKNSRVRVKTVVTPSNKVIDKLEIGGHHASTSRHWLPGNGSRPVSSRFCFIKRETPHGLFTLVTPQIKQDTEELNRLTLLPWTDYYEATTWKSCNVVFNFFCRILQEVHL